MWTIRRYSVTYVLEIYISEAEKVIMHHFPICLIWFSSASFQLLCHFRFSLWVFIHDILAFLLFQAPIVLSRDHHDVSGADSPFRETSNITDGSAFTAGQNYSLLGDIITFNEYRIHAIVLLLRNYVQQYQCKFYIH